MDGDTGHVTAAFEASLLQDEERLWTELIDKYDGSKAPWRADIVGRAFGNRGNARSRQGKMDIALVDYNRAIQICPWSVDPVLNRSAADSTLAVGCYCVSLESGAQIGAGQMRMSIPNAIHICLHCIAEAG